MAVLPVLLTPPSCAQHTKNTTQRTRSQLSHWARRALIDRAAFYWRKGFHSKPRGSGLGGVLASTSIDDFREETDGMLVEFLDGINLESR